MLSYNAPVSRENHLSLAQALTDEAAALLESGGWRSHGTRGGIQIETKDAVFLRHDPAIGSKAKRAMVFRGRVAIDAPRKDVFAYLADLDRTGEWDPTDAGYKIEDHAEGSTATVLCSIPEGFLPEPIMKVINIPGWRSILTKIWSFGQRSG